MSNENVVFQVLQISSSFQTPKLDFRLKKEDTGKKLALIPGSSPAPQFGKDAVVTLEVEPLDVDLRHFRLHPVVYYWVEDTTPPAGPGPAPPAGAGVTSATYTPRKDTLEGEVADKVGAWTVPLLVVEEGTYVSRNNEIIVASFIELPEDTETSVAIKIPLIGKNNTFTDTQWQSAVVPLGHAPYTDRQQQFPFLDFVLERDPGTQKDTLFAYRILLPSPGPGQPLKPEPQLAPLVLFKGSAEAPMIFASQQTFAALQHPPTAPPFTMPLDDFVCGQPSFFLSPFQKTIFKPIDEDLNTTQTPTPKPNVASNAGGAVGVGAAGGASGGTSSTLTTDGSGPLRVRKRSVLAKEGAVVSVASTAGDEAWEFTARARRVSDGTPSAASGVVGAVLSARACDFLDFALAGGDSEKDASESSTQGWIVPVLMTTFCLATLGAGYFGWRKYKKYKADHEAKVGTTIKPVFRMPPSPRSPPLAARSISP